MLAVQLIAVGKLRERYLADACAEYQKRIGSLFRLELIELEEGRLSAEPSERQIAQCLDAEGARILEKIPKRSAAVALCVEGRQMRSEDFARYLETAAQSHPSVSLIIGSSHGLSESVKRACALRLSLSAMTFPHQLARVVLLEQLYRAGMISAGRKYHK